MTRALLLANKALSMNEIPVGAVLVYNNFEFSIGVNSCFGSLFSHAEFNLINKANFYLYSNFLSKSTLYITIEPCINCLSMLFYYRLNKVIFGAYTHNYLLNNSYNKLKVKGGILEEESVYLLKLFFSLNKR